MTTKRRRLLTAERQETSRLAATRRRRIVVAFLVVTLLVATTALATTFTVTVGTDDGTGGTVGTLSNAIISSTNGDVIDIHTDVAITGTLSLPEINHAVTIQTTAGPFTITGNNHQIFSVNSGTAGTTTIKDLTLFGGLAQGGAGTSGNGGGGGGLGGGGALYIGTNTPNGTAVVLENVVFKNNSAIGGTGGVGTNTGTNGGNSGGYDANANTPTAGSGGVLGGSGNGANGGYGGGGAGSGITGTISGTGNGGGSGGRRGEGGSGGLALGGAVFVANGSFLTISGTTGIDASNTVTGGISGTGTLTNGVNGTPNGGGLYVGIGSGATLDTTLNNISITGNVYSNGNITLTGNTSGTVGFFGSAVLTDNGSMTLSAGTLVLGSTATSTFTGNISGTGGIDITGTGTVIMTGTNTYSGGTTLVAGGFLGGNTTGIQGAITNSGTVSFFNVNPTGTAFAGSYNGNMNGTGKVFVTGTGAVTFGGTNTYTGGTSIGAGASLTGSTTSVQGNILNFGTVTLTQAGTGTYSGNMTGTGGLVSNVTQTLQMTGANTYSGGTTVNAGTLQGSTTGVQGNIRNNSVVDFSQTGTGTYSGNMSGTGALLLNNTGTVVLTGANTYSGVTTINSGTLQASTTSLGTGNTVDNSHLIFNQTTTGTYAGTISGTGDVTKIGSGNLIFSGAQTYSGNTTVNAGRLSVNSGMASDVFVSNGGTLGGVGTIAGDVFNGGVVAPGNSIGTLTVATYTGNSSSTLQVEVNNGGTTAGVNNDLLHVNGNVTLSGGTVNVVTTTSIGFNGGSRYKIVEYTGARSGTFSGATINTPFLTPQLDYVDVTKEIDLLLFRATTTFASIAQTPNQAAVGSYIDQNNPTATGDFANVVDQLTLLSPADARSALDQVSGAIYGSAARVNIQNTTYMFMQIQRNTNFEGEFGNPRDIYGNPVVENRASPYEADVVLVGRSGNSGLPVYEVRRRQAYAWNAWTTGYGAAVSGDASTIGGYASGGNITSLYRYLNDFVKVGAFGGYNYTRLETIAPFQVNRTNDGQLGSYVRVDDGFNHFLAASSAGLDSHHSARVINFGNIDRTATASYDGWQSTVYSEVGRKFFSYPLDFEPFIGMQYTYLRQNGFQESGADSLNLNVAGINTNALWQLLGARVMNNWLNGMLEFRAIWLHDYLGSTTVLNSTFASVGGNAFATQGMNFGRNNALLGVGMTWNLTQSLNVAGNYDAYCTGNDIFHIGSGTLQYRW